QKFPSPRVSGEEGKTIIPSPPVYGEEGKTIVPRPPVSGEEGKTIVSRPPVSGEEGKTIISRPPASGEEGKAISPWSSSPPHMRRGAREAGGVVSGTSSDPLSRRYPAWRAPASRPLRSHSLVREEMPLLRFQFPSGERRCPGAGLRGGARIRSRACASRRLGAARLQHFLRRRHAQPVLGGRDRDLDLGVPRAPRARGRLRDHPGGESRDFRSGKVPRIP